MLEQFDSDRPHLVVNTTDFTLFNSPGRVWVGDENERPRFLSWKFLRAKIKPGGSLEKLMNLEDTPPGGLVFFKKQKIDHLILEVRKPRSEVQAQLLNSCNIRREVNDAVEGFKHV